MKKCIFIGLSIFTILNLFIACTGSMKERYDISAIGITWELKSNSYQIGKHSMASFTIKNNSPNKLTDLNWKLFFNMAPRPLIKSNSDHVATIEHINGDYYRLVPSDKFSLEPGDSIEIPFEFDWVMIKESDAPRGLYFVAYNKKGKEQGIFQVKDYQIKPMESAVENSLRNAGIDSHSLSEWQYRQNEKIIQLPEYNWQAIIPNPVKLVKSNKQITIDSTFLIVSDKALYNEARHLKDMLLSKFGLKLNYAESNTARDKCIQLTLKPMMVNGIKEESYKMAITESGIQITGNDRAGVFYGIQSMLSLIPVERYGKPNNEIVLNVLQIEDAPRFTYRGLHIDVCRHFQPKAEILKVMDLMAFYKLNKLHLYLTEDEGWRIEIKGLPELTQVGSKRGHCPAEDIMLNPAYGSGPDPDNAEAYGSGYYSRQDFIEIIKYAHSRHIQVIPSINFPGHARAAIKSMEVRYKRLMKEGKKAEAEEYRLVDPGDKSLYNSAQFYDDNIVNVALDGVYKFYETVIAEIADIYKEAAVPFTFIHTGGDEVPKGAWSGLTKCNKLMQRLQIKESRDLQSYFSDRMLKILNKYNLTAGGWEEIALKRNENDELDVNAAFIGKNMVPYVWNNLEGAEDLGYKLANAGYPVVLCCVTNFYLDMAYNSDPKEPGLYWGGFTDEYDPWVAAPFNLTGNSSNLIKLKKEKSENILGLQAQLWGETIIGPDMLEYYLLPKLISFAERAWAAQPIWEEMTVSDKRNKLIELQWNSFINAVSQRELPRLNTLFGGFNYRVPPPGAVIEKGILRTNTQYPGYEIFYTKDGTNPDENSIKYSQPVEAISEVLLISIDKVGKKSRVLSMNSD